MDLATKALGSPRRKQGAELFWLCPCHADTHPSLQVNPDKDVFLCGPCGKSGGTWRFAAFLGRIDPTDKKAIGGWLHEHGFERNGNGHNPMPDVKPKTKPTPTGQWQQVAAFNYTDALRKVRFECDAVDQDTGKSVREKKFQWQCLENGKWKPGTGGNQIPLYVNTLFGGMDGIGLVLGFEGEAKADLSATFGFAAFSFKQITAEQCSTLADCDIVLWPDKDDPGRKQVADARQLIIAAKLAKSLRTIQPPTELPIGSDIIDAVRDFGYDKAKIQTLIDAAKSERVTPPEVGIVLAGVKEERIEWLWDHRIPLGAITVLDGDPGGGKSLLTCELTSRITRGAPLPGKTEFTEPAGVVILTAEDSIKHVVVPRLRVAGSDLSRVIAVPYSPEFEGQPTISKIPMDIPILAKAIQRIGARLVIIDVFMAYLPPSLSASQDQDVRTALAPLSELADRLRCSFLMLRHLNKQKSGIALYRGGSSIGIAGAARSVLLLARDPTNPDIRVLAMVKSNFGAMAESLGFRINATDGIPHIEWCGVSAHTADGLLAESTDEERGDIASAKDFLLSELSEGQIEAVKMFGVAKKLGISERTLKRAKVAIGVISTKLGARWFWELPE